jgi:hypothetical protein
LAFAPAEPFELCRSVKRPIRMMARAARSRSMGSILEPQRHDFSTEPVGLGRECCRGVFVQSRTEFFVLDEPDGTGRVSATDPFAAAAAAAADPSGTGG